jgi:hypothetical protein
VPYFRSDQYDVKIQALGFVDPAHDVRRFQPKGRNLLLYSSAGRVTRRCRVLDRPSPHANAAPDRRRRTTGPSRGLLDRERPR